MRDLSTDESFRMVKVRVFPDHRSDAYTDFLITPARAAGLNNYLASIAAASATDDIEEPDVVEVEDEEYDVSIECPYGDEDCNPDDDDYRCDACARDREESHLEDMMDIYD